jgi:hypothetical protein
MNAFRKQIGSEELCDKLVLDAMSKGPKRIRILSREELKIEVNKFKNISMRLMDEMKVKKIKVPGYAMKLNIDLKEVGYRDDDKKEMGAMDHLETQSDAGVSQQMSQFNEGEATETQLISETQRLE